MRKLENKLVLITGGASGVGLECAKHFAQLGAHLLLIGRDKKKLGWTCRFLSNQFRVNVLQLAGDVKDSKFAFAAVDYARSSLGAPVDVLINNAGIIFRGDASETDDQNWKEVIDTNLNGAFYFSRVVAKQMSNGGAIVNISSSCGSRGSAGLAAYCVSKAAVNMLTKTMALELASKRINVNAVAPGAVNSPMLFSNHTDGASARAIRERNTASVPMGSIAETQEVARAVIFLCQETHITGEIMAIDGGYTAG